MHQESNYLSHFTDKQLLVLAHHIIARWGFDEATYTHCSVRQSVDTYWLKRQGDLFSQVTEERLNLYHVDGRLLKGDQSEHNVTGQSVHHAIYKKRGDVNAIIHLHSPASVAVSTDPRGLMMLSQWALHFYNQISYHTYNSLSLHNSQGEQIALDLADKPVCLMRQHGYIVVGRTMAEALFFVHHLEHACQAQVLMSELAQSQVIPHEMCEQTVSALMSFEDNLGVRDMTAFVRNIIAEGQLDKVLNMNEEKEVLL